MSDQATRVTPDAAEVRDHGPDLSRFLTRHHAALIFINGPLRGAEYPLCRESTVLGRSRDADLVFDEETISREHAAIRFESGLFVLEDLGSANGSHVNGSAVHEVDLHHGDVIQMGRVRMKMILEEREPEPRTQVLDED